jgi:hypothetical protein
LEPEIMNEPVPPTLDDDNEAEHSETSRTAPYVVAVIHKSAVEHLPVTVPPHELLILARVHGGHHKIQIEEDADLPDGLTEATFEPEDEYARLEQRYGMDADGRSFAATEFGSVDGFISRLDSIEAGGAPRARASRAKAAPAPKAKATRSKA